MALDFVLTREELITLAITLGAFFLFLLFVYVILREFRLMRTDTRKAELELDREKLKLLQQDILAKGYPFTRLSQEQLNSLKELDEENVILETDIYAREKIVEGRLRRLENYVKLTKLENLLEKIRKEEKKMG